MKRTTTTTRSLEVEVATLKDQAHIAQSAYLESMLDINTRLVNLCLKQGIGVKIIEGTADKLLQEVYKNALFNDLCLSGYTRIRIRDRVGKLDIKPSSRVGKRNISDTCLDSDF